MESEIKNQNDLLQQLKSLRAEKELLEKHVFLLNECLSVEELKAKISNLEKKKEMLASLETVINRLKTEVEPLGYLKSILENKESHTNQNGSESCIKLESSFSNIGMESINASTNFNTQKIPAASNKTQKFPSLQLDKFTDTIQTVTNSVDKLTKSIVNDGIIDECMQLLDQNIPSTSTKTQTFSSMKFDEIANTIQTVSNSVGKLTKSIVSDGSFDECVQLLEQYDVLSDHEILIKSNVNDLEPQKLTEPTLSDDNNVLQDKQTATTSTYFDSEGINIQLKNGKILSVKEHVGSNVIIDNLNSQVHNDSNTPQLIKNLEENTKSSPTIDNHGNQLHEPSTSKSVDNLKVTHLNPNLNISDLLLKIPQILLQQGINSIKVDEKSNGLLKSVKDITNALLEESKDTKHSETLVKDDDLEAISNEKTNNESIEPTELSEISPTPIAENSGENVCSFNSMNLNIGILRGIYSLGFVKPTALQQRVIIHCLHGRDVIVFAGPGNGRTMLFTIPLLQQMLISKNKSQVTQGLILVPNRDLAVHIQKILLSVGDFLGLTVCIGGDNVPRKLSVVPHIVVGTPAGVSSMISCKSLNTDFIQFVVINKADEMLTKSHTKLIEEIMRKLAKDKQVTLLASNKLDHILDMYMDTLRDPLVIIHEDKKENESEILKGLPKQFFLKIQEEWKLNALCEVFETLKIFNAVIYCNSSDRAQKLSESLQRLDYGVSVFNLEMNTQNREHILNLFSFNQLRMIITTDPIKGSMFQQANWIVNYDCPINHISYLDRIAKCAKQIKVLNFINENDDDIKLAIENHNKSYMIPVPLNMVDLFEY